MSDEFSGDATGPGPGPASGGPEPVGSVGEEAAKLFAALQDWAKESGSEQAAAAGDAAASAAAGLAGAAKAVNEHIATGGQDCRYCPVCQVIAAVRQTSPEVRAHLTTAATSLLHAASGFLATQVPEERTRRGPVQRIDLSDEDSDWEDDE